MTKYLYGAAVQGIQGFIFQTNDLKDVVGASELVEQICTTAFNELVGEQPNIIHAAGNIKHVFDSKEQCEKVVREYPRRVMNMAPGITFSQAVVALDDNKSFADQIEQLEKNLRIQRNRPMPSTTLGLMAIKRSPKTGLPARPISAEQRKKLGFKPRELVDRGTIKKREASDNMLLVNKCFAQANLNRNDVAFDIEDMTLKNDWIAIIHADGNGLGQVVQAVGNKQAEFREFSRLLDEATTEAANKAYDAIHEQFEGIIPIRPVVLGGDDLTVMIRADLAVPYAKAFINAFEDATEAKLGQILQEQGVFNGRQRKLTCCAGIAFIKSSFPFHYGYDLAEQLCEQAKKDAKDASHLLEGGLAPSCLMFHKVQDSFVESFSKIEKRELLPNDESSWKFGPYYLNKIETEDRWTIDKLMETVKQLDEEDENARVVKSHLRQWMTLMHESRANAERKSDRVESILSDKQRQLWQSIMTFSERLDEKNKSRKHYPSYDLLALHTVVYQETN